MGSQRIWHNLETEQQSSLKDNYKAIWNNVWEVYKRFFLSLLLQSTMPCSQAHSEVISCFPSVFTGKLMWLKEQQVWWPWGSLLCACVHPGAQSETPRWYYFLSLPSEGFFSFVIISPSSHFRDTLYFFQNMSPSWPISLPILKNLWHFYFSAILYLLS